VPSALDPLIADIQAAVQTGDDARFRRCLASMHTAGQNASADDLTGALDAMASWLCTLNGLFAKAALVAGAFVEWGGSPLPLAAALPGWAAYKMQLYALFQDVWPRASGGRPLPDQQDLAEMRPAIAAMTAWAEQVRLPTAGLDQIVATWFDLEDWLNLMITLMVRREFRAAMAERDELSESAAALADTVRSAKWVHGLSVVLDGAPLVALDPVSRRGFLLTMSGVGDRIHGASPVRQGGVSRGPAVRPGAAAARVYWRMMLGGAPPQDAGKWDGDRKCPFIPARFTWPVDSGCGRRADTPLSEFTGAGTGTFGGQCTGGCTWPVCPLSSRGSAPKSSQAFRTAVWPQRGTASSGTPRRCFVMKAR
jgi:hypothetical protein